MCTTYFFITYKIVESLKSFLTLTDKAKKSRDGKLKPVQLNIKTKLIVPRLLTPDFQDQCVRFVKLILTLTVMMERRKISLYHIKRKRLKNCDIYTNKNKKEQPRTSAKTLTTLLASEPKKEKNLMKIENKKRMRSCTYWRISNMKPKSWLPQKRSEEPLSKIVINFFDQNKNMWLLVVLWEVACASSAWKPVERISMTEDLDLSFYVNSRTPVILENAVPTEVMENLSLDHLYKYEDHHVFVQVVPATHTDLRTTNFGPIGVVGDTREYGMSFGDLLDLLRSSGKKHPITLDKRLCKKHRLCDTEPEWERDHWYAGSELKLMMW